MPRQYSYTKVLQLLIIVVAYGYLAYRLITFDTSLFDSISTDWSLLQVLSLVVAFLLFPLNILFESLKWRTLLQDIEPDMTLVEAQRQTYYGFVGAFITPSRLGDYPARALLLKNKEHWLSAVALGFVGSLLLVLVISVIGLPAMMELFIGQQLMTQSDTLANWHYSWAIAAFIFLLVLAGCLPQMSRWLERRFRFRKEQTRQMIHALSQLKSRQLLTASAWTLLRYLTFCLQLYLILTACDTSFSLFTNHSSLTTNHSSLFTNHSSLTTNYSSLMLALPTYYLLITITPSVPAADVAIKGSWAIVLFSALGGNVWSITLATVLIWLINTICPMLIGTFVKRTTPST